MMKTVYDIIMLSIALMMLFITYFPNNHNPGTKTEYCFSEVSA